MIEANVGLSDKELDLMKIVETVKTGKLLEQVAESLHKNSDEEDNSNYRVSSLWARNHRIYMAVECFDGIDDTGYMWRKTIVVIVAFSDGGWHFRTVAL